VTDTGVHTAPSAAVEGPRAATRPAVPAAPALAIVFGRFADGGKLAGRYHAPVGPARGGVVLCSPGGVEDFGTYATYRMLAERLAARGLAVLRFDYHGQGDSVGDDGMPSRVQAWKDSVSFAIDALAARSSATSIGLFGLRLGATLAAIVAAERGGVAALALWAPVSGRAFLREFRAYGLLNPHSPPPADRPSREGDQEAAGFLLTAETMAELGGLDLTRVATPPAPRALVLPRDGSSNEEKVIKRLEALGVEVTKTTVPGFATMMAEPRKAVAPEQAIEVITSWFVGHDGDADTVFPSHEAGQDGARPDAAASIEGSRSASESEAHRSSLGDAEVIVTRAPYAVHATVREGPLRFGPENGLFGVVTEPLEKGPRAKTALILLTAASRHRIGAHRTHVAFAREVAARGFTALRFDIHGIGDSASLTGPPHPYAFEPVKDISAAIDALQRLGVTRIVLAGLCSGAFLAYHGALADQRVQGTVQFNPQIFYFKEGDSLEIGRGTVYKSTRTYIDLLSSSEPWKRLARGEVNVRFVAGMLAGRIKRKVEVRLEDTLARWRGGGGNKPNVRRDFQTICKRGCRVLLVFSAVDEGIDYVEAHLGANCKAMRGYPEFEMKIIDGPDHAFVPVWSHERASEILCEELETHFG
jgi:dienelactone hydrolase